MLKHHPMLIAMRQLIMAGCLGLLAACGGGGSSSGSNGGPSTGGNSTSTVPAVPSGVTATSGSSSASLQWTASTDATGYNVKRATTSGGPYSQIAAPTSPAYT